MKVMISYFNNIRNFTSNMIPLSTAMWDPKWYRKDGIVYIDKRGVINGLKAEKLVLKQHEWVKLENKDDDCVKCIDAGNNLQDRTQLKDFCPFMKCYLEQLRKINFSALTKWLEAVCEAWYQLTMTYQNLDDIVPVLIVHEKPDRLCCERYVLKQWFKENGVELEEVAHK